MTPPLSGRRHSIGLNGQVPPSRRGRRTSAARVGRPPGSNREETIARLVTAAQQHFGERGFSGARMVDIASDAGVTHSSIYQYFSSKDACTVLRSRPRRPSCCPTIKRRWRPRAPCADG